MRIKMSLLHIQITVYLIWQLGRAVCIYMIANQMMFRRICRRREKVKCRKIEKLIENTGPQVLVALGLSW